MKRQEINNSKRLEPQSVVRYLQTRGWKQSGQLGNGLLIYEFQNNPDIDLVLPPEDSPAFDIYVKDAIRVISYAEGRSFDEIWEEIANWNYDSIAIRLLDESNPSLWATTEILDYLRLFLAYSAAQEISPRPYFSTPTKAASDFARVCEFAHTERKSFAFIVQVPVDVQLELWEEDSRPTLGRNVMERVMTGLAAFSAGEVLGIEDGFNANMCEAFSSLAAAAPSDFEVFARWSTERAPSVSMHRIKVTQQLHRTIQQAGRRLRTREVSEEEEMQGPVIQLRKELEWLESGEEGGLVEVYWRQPRKHAVKLIVHLGKEGHKEAIYAYEKNLDVVFQGRREKLNNRWHVFDPTGFRLAAKAPEELAQNVSDELASSTI